MIYKPERRFGCVRTCVSELTRSCAALSKHCVNITDDGRSQRDDIHCLVNSSKLQQKSDDFLFASIDADGFDDIMVKGLEVDFGRRYICTRTNIIYECLERVLGYDDLID